MNLTRESTYEPQMPCLFSKGDYRIVRDAVQQLDDEDKAVVALKFWENYSNTEIADALRLPIEEIERRLKRAFRLLKVWCENHPDFSRSNAMFAMSA